MAVLYRKVRGMPLQQLIAHHVDVQVELAEKAFEIALRAEEALVQHKQDGHARIDLLAGDIDWYVVLDDTRGLDAAMSIEFGRAGFIDPDTGLIYDRMDPLYILTDAANLPRKKFRKPKIKKIDPRYLKKIMRLRKVKEVKDLGGRA